MKNTKIYLIMLTAIMLSAYCFGQPVAFYDVTAANGNGLRFWSSDNYKIHMGAGAEYQYGPVTDMSIKMNMNSSTTRGWTWGVSGLTPVAALNTQGKFQLASDLYSMGKVGIGTITPYELLHIYNPTTNGPVGIRFNIKSDSYYIHWNFVLERGAPGDSYLYLKVAQPSTVSNANPTAWTTKFRFDYSGRFNASNFTDNDNSNFYLDPSSSTTSLNVAGKLIATGLSVTDNLGYCINPSNSTLSLKAAGKIECKEIEVKLMSANNIESKTIETDELNVKMDNLADYVFDENYSQMSLYDLEQFINANKHLPGVPSAKEVKDKGMDVAEMNNTLLQKIEELTLYTIEQAKLLEQIKLENQKLSQRLEALEKN